MTDERIIDQARQLERVAQELFERTSYVSIEYCHELAFKASLLAVIEDAYHKL